jgi:hypothetical protein
MKLVNRKRGSHLSLFIAISFVIVAISNLSAVAQQPKDAAVDFNGDGKTDISILRSAGFGTQMTWWNLESGTGNVTTLDLGTRAIDQPVAADYDGDGKDDIAVYRFTGPEAGNWYILQSSTGTFRIEKFGITRDNPTIVDDYDGDGKDDLAVYRQSSSVVGQSYFFYKGSLNNPDGNITYVPWGMRYGTQSTQGDDPYTGDFDGDGKADFGIQRAVDTASTSDGPALFWVLLSSGGTKIEYFGNKSDRVVPGDYDGDNKVDIAVARGFNISPGNTTWYIRYSSGIPDDATIFGAGFNFAQGDYDGDGKTDIAYFILGATPEEIGFWYLASATNNESRFVRWGARPAFPSPGAGDLPAAGYNNR